MNIEKNRLRTFDSWPANVTVEPQRIAKAGFFYTGQGLEVQCFSCGGKISEWNSGDQVMERHRILDPHCAFVLNPDESLNIALLPGAEILANQNHTSSLSPPLTAATQSSDRRSSISSSKYFGAQQKHLLRREAIRLQSLLNWPLPFTVSPERLAKAGFFCFEEGTQVQCVFCEGIIWEWKVGDDPDIEHRKHFPLCPFIQNAPVGNIPLADEPSTSSSEDRSGGVGTDMIILGIHSHRRPHHPEYSTVESRLRTFARWPVGMRQTAPQLAQAGFYYFGVHGQVRCFYCDGVLRYWNPNDNPWTEHARWLSHCGFVRLAKGEDFIQDAIKKRPQLLTRIRRPEGTEGVEQRQKPYLLRGVTEHELHRLMGMAPATAALEVGLDASHIKLALKCKVEETSLPFSTPAELVQAALAIQRNKGGSKLPSRKRNHEESDTETESE